MEKARKLLLFAGTTEGRELADFLEQQGISCHICVATEYGETLIEQETSRHQIHVGRRDEPAMEELMRREEITDVVDATHPYAVLASENIRVAAERTDCRYLRLLRESSGIDQAPGEPGEGCGAELFREWVCVDSVAQAASYLAGQPGNIFAATGSKELREYTAIPDYRSRVFARVLSTAESVRIATELGFQGRNLICMQGPFSEELNVAMLQAVSARWLVTKESGKTGGFPEKVRAARRAGARLVVVGRPPQEKGCSLAEAKKRLAQVFFDQAAKPNRVGDIPLAKRRIDVIGIGMGAPDNMTVEAQNACREADVLIGAGRMLEAAAALHKPVRNAYLAGEIYEYVMSHPQYRRVAILLSGDVGFYSGAKKLLGLFQNEEVHVISGISSVVYLCGKLHASWEDVKLVSLHGRTQNLIAAVRAHKKVFALVGKESSFHQMCRLLSAYGFGDLRIHVGCELSYPGERILTGRAEEMAWAGVGDLTAVLIENPRAGVHTTHGIRDMDFLRGKVPMTKEEVRSISLSKLQLRADSVVYDVGAGTGSVSVEMALCAPEGQVFAIEKKEEAAILIEKNRTRFAVPNLQVIRGTAPEALWDLPAPTHAFIGGSSGNLREIMRILLEKNSSLRIVINAIALETVSEALDCLKTLPVTDVDIASVSVGKSREAGVYHMMMGQNPVYVISCSGRGDEEWSRRSGHERAKE